MVLVKLFYIFLTRLKKIYIGTGGSINTDCGIGMAHALWHKLL